MASMASANPPGQRPDLFPGAFVRHPDRPDWGLGQVQSAVGGRVTVNFENAGKVTVETSVVDLAVLPGPS